MSNGNRRGMPVGHENPEANIGMKCRKTSSQHNTMEPGKFKSGSKINTIKGVITHPIIGGQRTHSWKMTVMSPVRALSFLANQ